MGRYKRIIDRNAELGVTHIVYEPFNSLRSSRKTATDGWGWEGSLWLSMGEQIRNGSWAPAAGTHTHARTHTHRHTHRDTYTHAPHRHAWRRRASERATRILYSVTSFPACFCSCSCSV